MVCYEDYFPQQARKQVLRGSDIFIVQSNDAWFGKYKQPTQHFYFGMARALEFRRPMIRVSNAGISGIIDANGDIVIQSQLNVLWDHLLEISIPKKATMSIFASWGEYLFIIYIAFYILLCAITKCYKIPEN